MKADDTLYIFSADGKVCRGSAVISAADEDTVYFVEPLPAGTVKGDVLMSEAHYRAWLDTWSTAWKPVSIPVKKSYFGKIEA